MKMNKVTWEEIQLAIILIEVPIIIIIRGTTTVIIITIMATITMIIITGTMGITTTTEAAPLHSLGM